MYVTIIICSYHNNSSVLNCSTTMTELFQTGLGSTWLWILIHEMHWLGNFETAWVVDSKQICLTVVEKVLLNFQSYMNIQCVFTRNMAKLTCDSLLDLTSNAKMVTGSPVPYNRFMKYICQKQFWKQILALLKKKIQSFKYM